MAATVVDEGARIVREYLGHKANVLVYKRRCDSCGYLAPRTSFAVAMLSYDEEASSYETEGFSCPRCANHQAVRIRLGSGDGEGS